MGENLPSTIVFESSLSISPRTVGAERYAREGVPLSPTIMADQLLQVQPAHYLAAARQQHRSGRAQR